jgi:hypothetical protein
MPNLKLQVSRALSVYPSDDTNIPMPSLILQGIASSASPFKLIDSTVDFIALGVQVGDTVYANTLGAMVTNVDSANVLTLNLDIISGSGDAYELYSGTNMSGTIEPSVLYVGVGGDVSVVTAGGDTVTFAGVQSGSFLPVHVIRVLTSTSASKIVALW